MSYKFKADETVVHAFRRIGASQIKKAIASLESLDEDPVEAIHDARKRCKKLRALVRLVRPVFPGYALENAAFRDAARLIAGSRDGQALLESFDRLLARRDGAGSQFAWVQARLEEERDVRLKHLPAVAESLELLREAELRCSSWELKDRGFSGISPGLKKTYRRARQAYRDCRKHPDPTRLHEWRKRVKYHGFHLQLLGPLWAPMSQGQKEGAKELADLLGDHHDLVNLWQWLDAGELADENEEDVAELRLLVQGRMAELEEDALATGRVVMAMKPRDLLTLFERWWKRSRCE